MATKIIGIQNKQESGAGDDLTISAGSGNTSGAGGNITITPGAQAVSGGPGKVVIDTLTVGRGASGVATNTAVGVSALNAVTSGGENTAIGNSAGALITTAVRNTLVGYLAGQKVTSSSNTLVGSSSGSNMTTGDSNTGVGKSTLNQCSTGFGHTAIGADAGSSVSTSNNNTLIGFQAGTSVQDGSNNVCLGRSAGAFTGASDNITAISDSVFLGYLTRSSTVSDANAIVIGASAKGEGSNTTVIGTSSTTQCHLYGATQRFGSGAAATIIPFQRTTSGAGNDITIKATDGFTSGAGGSISLQPGAQATTGGNGKVNFLRTGGTTAISISPNYNTNNGGVLWYRTSDGAEIARINCSDTANGSLTFDCPFSFTFNQQTTFGGSIAIISNGIITFGVSYNGAMKTAGRGTIGIYELYDCSNGGSLAFKASTPAEITTSQNNYVLTGSAFQRLNCTAASDITGVAPPGGSHVDGRMITIHNVGTAKITLKHDSSSSTAANRFITPTAGDIVLGPNRIVQAIYDGTSTRWRLHGETYPYIYPTTDGSNNQVLTTNGSGTLSWSTVSSGGAGTVTSVGLSLPNIFSVSGSPVQSSGTLTGTLANQNANLVFAGPSGGAATTPAFRSLVASDLPTITSLGTVTSGTWNATAIGIAYGGTGQTTATAAFNALSPITTLGDIVYGSGTNAATRLAGNTTATKNFLSQTGTGSVSAAPSWSTVSKSDVGLGSVENTALSTWAGTSSITTLGTIATGTWSATNIALNKGGTAASLTAVNGGIVYSSASAMAITAAGTSNQVLISNGAAAPTWATINTLPVVSVSDTAPSGVSAGSLWWESSTGTLKVYYNDGTSSQWVDTSPASSSIGGTLSGVQIQGYSETKTSPTISAGALTLNIANGNTFTVSLNANITSLSITNVPTGTNAVSFTLILTADGTARTITWPASVKWPGAVAPTLTSTLNKIDVYTFLSVDNGTTWLGMQSGKNF